MDTATESGERRDALTGWEGLGIVALLVYTVALFIGVNQYYLWYYSEDHAEARATQRGEAQQAALTKAVEEGLSGPEAMAAVQKAADDVGPEITPSESMPRWAWVVLAIAYLIPLVVWWVFAREGSVVRPIIEAAVLFTVMAGLFVGTNQLYVSHVENRAEQRKLDRDQATEAATAEALEAGSTEAESEAAGRLAAEDVGPLIEPGKFMPTWIWAALAVILLALLIIWWALASPGVARSVMAAIVFFAFTAGYFIGPPKLYAPYIQNKADHRSEARKLAFAAANAETIKQGKTEDEAKNAGEDAADEIGPAIRANKPMPIWMWLVLGMIYLMIVTVWWTPGDQKANDYELMALAIVGCGGAILAAIIFQEQVVGIVKEFWNIMATGGGRTG